MNTPRTHGQCPTCRHYGSDCKCHESDRLKAAFKVLLGSGLTQAEVLEMLAEHGDKYPEYAAQVETSDDLEMDSPLYSYGEDGVWVSCWVHIRHPEQEESES